MKEEAKEKKQNKEEMQQNTRIEKITTRDGKQKDQLTFIFEYKK